VNIPEWLFALGIPAQCITSQSAAEEQGRRFTIRPRRGADGDTIWRVAVDGCWLDGTVKKVDYLFWGQTGAGRRLLLLVELKGQDFGKALAQIESTLQQLCKSAADHGIHTGTHVAAPGHDTVKAYVVLSRGKGVPLRQKERERIRLRYGVIVYPGEKRCEFDGLAAVEERS